MPRKLWVFVCAASLFFSMLAGQGALSESVSLFEINYDDSMTRDFYKTYYPFPETILFLNDPADNQVLVMLLSREEYPSVTEYLENAHKETAENCQVVSYSGVKAFTYPSGVQAEMTDMIIDEDGQKYKEYNICSDFDEFMQAVQISVSLSDQRDEAWADEFAMTLLNEQFAMRRIVADDLGTGYARGMKTTEDGASVLTVELVDLVQEGDEFTYFVNTTGKTVQYPFAEDAAVYLPSAGNFVTSRQVDFAGISESIRALYEADENSVFEFAVKDGKIIWMDYCDLLF